MAPKRNVKELVSSPQRHAKKQKKDPLAEKLNQQLREVTTALSQADVTAEMEKMLSIVLPLSLGEFSDQRHRFQQQVVDEVQGLLNQVEAALNKDAAEKRLARDSAASEKPLREREAASALEKLSAKIAEVHGLKVALADIAIAFRVAKTALTDTEQAKVVDGQKAQQAEKKKSDLSVAVADLRALKVAAPDDTETRKKIAELISMLRKYKFEESMMIALPAALAKAPDARGQFDSIAISQLEGEIDKLIEEQDATLVAAVPGQEKCNAAIKQAQDHLAEMQGKQRAAAKAFDIASLEQATCEEESTAAQKVVKEYAQSFKKLEKALHNAEVEVEVFVQGPKETFKVLGERVTPAPAPTVEEEAAAPAPVVEELELPVAT